MNILSTIFRKLPQFKGKLRLASLLLKSNLNKKNPVKFVGKQNIHFTIPNTIDTVGKELFINGIYERETINVIIELLKENSIFVDVGANIGAISLPLAKKRNIKIHVFEPSRVIFEYLQQNVKNNKVDNITLNNYAVYSKDGIEIEFFEGEEKHGGSSLAQIYSEQPHYLVDTISLDAYCLRNKISKIEVLKIDVQGFEIEVLKGCQYLLKNKSIENIIFEFDGWAEAHANFDIGASQEFLLSNDYEIYTLKNKKIKSKIHTGSHMLWARPVK
jgi:FkbM family methyltransferase